MNEKLKIYKHHSMALLLYSNITVAQGHSPLGNNQAMYLKYDNKGGQCVITVNM